MGAAVNIFAHCPGWYVDDARVETAGKNYFILFYFILFFEISTLGLTKPAKCQYKTSVGA